MFVNFFAYEKVREERRPRVIELKNAADLVVDHVAARAHTRLSTKAELLADLEA